MNANKYILERLPFIRVIFLEIFLCKEDCNYKPIFLI